MMKTAKVDRVVPKTPWAFDAEVTDAFPDMLRRSIPQYDVMRDAVTAVAKRFLENGQLLLDLGCSRGDAMAPLIKAFGEKRRYYGVEVFDPMLEAAKARFQTLIEKGVVEIRKMDLRREIPDVCSSVVLAVLTNQFIPIEHRQRIIHEIYSRMESGGGFIMVEKILGTDAKVDSLMVDEYLKMKSANGYTREQIDRKRLSLEGVLVPLRAEWNEAMLRSAGFRQVECFWRWMNFAAWLGVNLDIGGITPNASAVKKNMFLGFWPIDGRCTLSIWYNG